MPRDEYFANTWTGTFPDLNDVIFYFYFPCQISNIILKAPILCLVDAKMVYCACSCTFKSSLLKSCVSYEALKSLRLFLMYQNDVTHRRPTATARRARLTLFLRQLTAFTTSSETFGSGRQTGTETIKLFCPCLWITDPLIKARFWCAFVQICGSKLQRNFAVIYSGIGGKQKSFIGFFAGGPSAIIHWSFIQIQKAQRREKIK